jgi:hypothetical protein
MPTKVASVIDRIIRQAADCVIAACCLPSLLLAQSASPQTMVDRLRTLQASDWTVRMTAFDHLRQDQEALKQPQVRLALINLLRLENSVLEATLRDSNERVGVEEKYGSEYVEYTDDLGDVVDSFADWDNPEHVCVLVHQSYDPDGQYAARITSHGRAALPCVEEMYRSDVAAVRAKAAAVIVQIVAASSVEFTAQSLQSANATIQRALVDTSPRVRSTTVDLLGKVGSENAIPWLERVATADAQYNESLRSFGIREAAKKAIEAIKVRAKRQ